MVSFPQSHNTTLHRPRFMENNSGLDPQSHRFNAGEFVFLPFGFLLVFILDQKPALTS